MSVTIYSLGDHESIRAALTGVAMIFDPSQSMLTGAGALGLGHFAGFGLLISFAFVMCSVILKQKMEIEQVVIVMVAYAVLFVPTTTVNVEDMHTGQVAVVDNVPIGVAFPGGIISSFTHKVAVTMEQVMRDASSEYIPQTDVGFVAPLKLLLSARNAATGDPYFAKNYNYYVSDCITPYADGKVASNLTDLRDMFNGLPAGPDADSPAATLYFSPSNNNGEMISCNAAASQLSTDYEELISGTDTSVSSPIPMSSMDIRMNAEMDNKPGIGPATKWSAQSDLPQFIETLAGSGVNAQKVISSLVLGDLTYKTFNCPKMGSPEYVTCVASLGQAMEQYKVDAAGQASLFQKTMIPAMNVFMFFFYAFAPLVALMIAMSGMKGLVQILPKYMFFGVWTQSWIPTAAIINYFIQRQTQEAIAGRLVTGDGIPLANVMQLYNTLSLKIAAASDLLAQAPLVTLALMSGSMYALANMATKSGDKYDEKITTPDALKTGSAASAESRFVGAPDITTAGSTANRGPAGTHLAAAQTGMFSLQYSSQVAQSEVDKQSGALTRSTQDFVNLSGSAGTEFGHSMTAAGSWSTGNMSSANYREGHNRALDFGRSLTRGSNAATLESSAKQLGLSLNKVGEAAAAAFATGAKMGLGGKGLQNFVGQSVKALAKDQIPQLAAKLGSAAPALDMVERFASNFEQSIGEQFSSKSQEMDSWAADFSQGKMSKDEQSFTDQVSKGFKSSFTEQLGQAKSNVKQHSDAVERAQSVQRGVTSASSFDERRAGVVGASSASFMEWARGEAERQGVASQVQGLSDTLKSRGHFVGPGEEGQREAAALSWALSRTGAASETAMRLAAAETNIDSVGSVPNASAVQQSVDNGLSGTSGAGLSGREQGRAGSAAAQASGAAGQARGEMGSLNRVMAERTNAAMAGVGQEDHQANVARADSAANISSAADRNDNRVTAMPPSETFRDASAKLQKDFKDTHGYSQLLGRFGQEVMDNPALAAVMAAGGAAAVADVLSSINNHHLGGLGGKGMSLPQYAGKVLGKLGSKLPGLATGAVARHGVATAVGAGALGVGAVATNVAAVAWDVYEVGNAVKEAMSEVDKGLTGPDPKGYIEDTLRK